MKTIVTTTIAVALTAMAIGATPALAKGNGGEEEREKLKAGLAEARANQQQSGPTLFERLFGFGDTQQAEAEAKQ